MATTQIKNKSVLLLLWKKGKQKNGNFEENQTLLFLQNKTTNRINYFINSISFDLIFWFHHVMIHVQNAFLGLLFLELF